MPNKKKVLSGEKSEHDVKSPLEYTYLKILRISLVSIASWPLKEMGMYESIPLTTFLKYFFMIMNSFVLTGSILYIVFHIGSLSFLEIGHMYIMVLLILVDISRVITLTFAPEYREVCKVFLTKVHLFYFKDRSEYAMKTHKQVHMVSHRTTLFVTIQMLSGLSCFNLIPMYNNLTLGKYKKNGLGNSTFEHSVYFSYPFDVSTNVHGYIFSTLFNWGLSYLCSTWICMFDLFLTLMVFHIWGHFKVLINNLDNFATPANKSSEVLDDGLVINTGMFSKDELLQVTVSLKECIDYHRWIKEFTDTLSDVFGPMLFVKYVYHQISGCLLLLECSQMTAAALIRYLPLTLICFQQLIQVSVIFELVGSASGRLKDAVYGLPWECMDTKNRQIVNFFLMNVQEPIHVMALGVANVGVNTMLVILKTSMSYFTFLRTI